VRVNKAGCLTMPGAGGGLSDAVWYHYVDERIDEIVDSHLVGGKVVERLLLSPDVGR
jgi:(2Fe-2S) ferredoxin